MDMEGFVNACLGDYLSKGQGVAGKALISNKPSFSSDSPQEVFQDDLSDAYAALGFMRDAGFKLDWLEKKLDIVLFCLFFYFNLQMFQVKDPKASLDFYSRVLGMSLLKRLDFSEMKFSLYFLGYEDTSTAPTDPTERLNQI
ncbi:unnamed protein product [Brassica oleracea]